jgi:hydrogenase/urease accessory protein HupE
MASYVSLGVEHILTGYDHFAFVIALLVASRRLRSILGVVTAFTVAHSLTLAAASTGHVSASADVVEPAIAASIVYVAVRNVVSKSERAPWLEAFGFGLVHGLGFAGSIAETLAGETQKLVALFGFNVGVEAGQLAVVGTLLVVVLAARRWTSSSRSQDGSGTDHADAVETPLVPRPVRVVASILVATAGAWWFVQRVALVVA